MLAGLTPLRIVMIICDKQKAEIPMMHNASGKMLLVRVVATDCSLCGRLLLMIWINEA